MHVLVLNSCPETVGMQTAARVEVSTRLHATWRLYSVALTAANMCRAAIDSARQSLMKGRGAAGVAATVAASVASKVNGGSMIKVSDDSPNDKVKGSRVSEEAGEGGRWWGRLPHLAVLVLCWTGAVSTLAFGTLHRLYRYLYTQ